MKEYKFSFGYGFFIETQKEFETIQGSKGYFMVVKEPYACNSGYESNLYEIGEKITVEENTFDSLCSSFFDYCENYLKSISPNDFIEVFLNAGTHISDDSYTDYELGITQGLNGINYREMRCELKVDLPPHNYIDLRLLFIRDEAMTISRT